MRISDWSSDVCSSDLAAHVNHVLDYESLARDNVEPIFECLRLCEGRSKKIFNFVSTLSASSALDADGQVLEQPAAKTRSEEHTSELQSLMRISYAVFCLKKKKTHDKKQTTT